MVVVRASCVVIAPWFAFASSRGSDTVKGVIDLHMHSTRSDGTEKPSQLARLAQAAGLRAVALTDHDTTEGNARFASALEELNEQRATDIEFIPGCEISCLHEETGRSTHVLCYRDSRNDRLVDLLQGYGYTKLTRRRIQEFAEKPLARASRPHFAAALIEAYPEGGKPAKVTRDDIPTSFTSTQQVFDDLLDARAPGYIPKANRTPAEAAEAARQSGAVTVIAHPIISFCKAPADGSVLSLEDKRAILDPILGQLASQGIVGAEAYYSRHTPEETELVLDLCRRHGLVATGGSDYHGTAKKDLEIGIGLRAARGTPRELKVPDNVVEQLKARRDALAAVEA
jgi:3',5'-nucleoside bisphosphate phosphatase